MAESKSAGNGVGFASLLGLLFIGLKLGHVIDWPWLWVLSPIWIPLALVIVAGVVVVAAVAMAKK